MKRLLFSLSLLLLSCFSMMAQRQIIVKTSSGEVDTYPCNKDTQIRLRNGKIEFQTPNATKEYSPSDIAKLGFNALIESIALNHEVYALQKGDSLALEATISPTYATNKTLLWRSSDEDVVTVTQDGVAWCINDGEAVVTATATDGSGVTASCTFTCTNGIAIVETDSQHMKIFKTDGKQLPKLRPGINIIKFDNNTVRKIFVKPQR